MADKAKSEDSTLLLELGIQSDITEFDKARDLIVSLKDSMEDLSFNLPLDGLISGLKSAVEVLRGLVQTWNTLEDKAIDITYNTNNYLPYNISPGQRQNISNRIAESRIAEKFGITEDTILTDLSNIISEQSKVNVLGEAYSPAPFIAVTRLADKLGVSGFSGNDIADMMLHMPTDEVYGKLTGLLSTAYRKAYTYEDSSREREDLLQFIKQVLETSFIDEKIGDYLAFMTMPENPTYGVSGNPIYRYFGATIEDEGLYMDALKKKGAKATEYSEDLSTLSSEAKESVNQAVLTVSNVLNEYVAIPFMKNLVMLTDIIGGKREAPSIKEVPEVMTAKQYMEWVSGLGNYGGMGTYARASEQDTAYFARRFGLSSNWVVMEDAIKRKNSILESLPEDSLSQELGAYEIWRMGLTTYEQDAKVATADAIEKLMSSKYFRSKYRNMNKRYKAVYEAIQDPESPYYLPESSGFLPIYSMLYSTGAINEQTFLESMGKIFENTNMADIAKRYGIDYTTGKDIIKADVVSSGKGEDKVWSLNITLRDAATGEIYHDTLTADEIEKSINVSFKDAMR